MKTEDGVIIMLTHIVLFKLKDHSLNTVKQVKYMLLSMIGKIPQLKHLEVGTDVVHSERSFDIALISKFDSLADMQAYQAHPVHVEVANFIATVRESAVSVDYEG